MVYQPPAGARDLFPLDVAQKSWIEARLQQVFHRWSYHRIITSTLERIDTLMAGGAIDRATVIQVQDIEEEMLGLRPELTASIARAAATRMERSTHPQRLYYSANVFQRPTRANHNRQQEFYQTGVELLGSGGVIADAEVLLLVADCLSNLKLTEWCLVLGEAGLTRSLLSVFPDPLRDSVRRAIAHLDRVALEALPLSPDLREQALLLLDLRGRPADVLQRVSSLELNPNQRSVVNNLKALTELLHDSFAEESAPPIILDLSLVQTIDYYTGIVFQVISSGATGQQILGRGGRYDQLLGLYHPQGTSYPGVGFTFHLEELHPVLLAAGQLPLHIPPSNWLVVPTVPQAAAAAFVYARKIRQSTNLVRVEVHLHDSELPAATREFAYQRQISQIAWISAEGGVEVEAVTAPAAE